MVIPLLESMPAGLDMGGNRLEECIIAACHRWDCVRAGLLYIYAVNIYYS